MIYSPRSAVFLATGLVASLLTAQSPVRKTWGGTWTPKRQSAVVSAGKFEVSMTNLDPTTDWVVAAQVASAVGVEVVVGDVSMSRLAPGSRSSAIQRIVDHAVSVQTPGVATVDCRGITGGLLVFIKLPPKTALTIRRDGAVVTSATPLNGIVVRNGEVSAEAVRGLQTAIGRLSNTIDPNDTKEVTVTPKGEYTATLRGLQTHIMSFKRPELSGSRADAAPVVFKISIDMNGRVISADGIRGDFDAMNAIRTALLQWQFRPFFNNAAPVAVTGTVFFFRGQNGEITSSVVE